MTACKHDFALVIALVASMVATSQDVSLTLPSRVVHQFSLPTYLNSIFVRSNGDIFVTTVWPNASIYCISSPNTDSPTVSLIHTFSEINAATAIVETQPNVLAFLGGNQSSLGIGINGSAGVWEVDLRPTLNGRNGKPIIQKLVHIAESGLLTGIRPLPDAPSTVLVSDSTAGLVWRVNTLKREYKLAMQDDVMRPPAWSMTLFGINGLQIRDGYLYWSNSYLATIYRIAITEDGYPAPGVESEHVATLRTTYLDGFCFGPRDNRTIWAATNACNRLSLTMEPFVAGQADQMTLAASVAPGFGTLQGDTNMLYIATSGGMVFPINGSTIEGGKIVAVDTTGFL